MSLTLTARAEILTQKRAKNPNLILEIEGVATLYSLLNTYKIARTDDGLFTDEGIFTDELLLRDDTKALLSLGQSSNTITQQLIHDKPNANSISSFKVELVDKGEEISQLVSPGFVVDDLLSKKATIYLNFDGGAHPNDSLVIHRGVVDEIIPGPASIIISVAHPETVKRQDILIQKTFKLNGSITNVQSTITLDSTADLMLPVAPYFYPGIKIDEEIILYTGISGNQLTGCTRGQCETFATAHDDQKDVSTAYNLKGNAIDLALKLMISGSDNPYATNVGISNIGAIDLLTPHPHALHFLDINVVDKYSLTIGDKVTITGSDFNDQADIVIADYEIFDNYSTLIFNETFVQELGTTGVCSFKSKHNILPDGLGLSPIDVDVEQHEMLLTNYSSSFVDYDFYITETIEGKSFINEQLYFPSSLYSIPRKSRVSVGFTLPPVSPGELVVLDETNIINVSKLSNPRSINNNFYNSVVVRYDYTYKAEPKKGYIAYSALSQNRIKSVGNRPFKIDAKGIRPGDEATIQTNANRTLDRYQYGTEYINNIVVDFKVGFTLECGDVVLFGSPNLHLVDITKGNRQFSQKAYEIINKSINLLTGQVQLNLLATGFDINGRYGYIPPSSVLGAGSTDVALILEPSHGSNTIFAEQKKWKNYYGEKCRVHSADYTFDYESTIDKFDDSNPYKLKLVSALPSTPSAGYILEIPAYNEVSAATNEKYKYRYVHLNPTISVVSGLSNTQFTVSVGDAAKLLAGQTIKLRSDDWVTQSIDVEIISKVGQTITVPDLGFTPDSTYSVELIGFLDGGLPYRIL